MLQDNSFQKEKEEYLQKIRRAKEEAETLADFLDRLANDIEKAKTSDDMTNINSRYSTWEPPLNYVRLL